MSFVSSLVPLFGIAAAIGMFAMRIRPRPTDGVSEPARADPVPASTPPPALLDPALEALLAPLPEFARTAFARAQADGDAPPRTPADLFERVDRWAGDADATEARGGFPGGRGQHDWSYYVRSQRDHIAVFHALANAYGEPEPPLARRFRDLERRFPSPIRKMGDGYEPHVDDEAGRLIYSLPVDSGFVGLCFSFRIYERDLAVLLADPYRRAILEVAAHTILQRSMVRGAPEVTGAEFANIVDRVLHSNDDDVAIFIATVDRSYNTGLDYFIRKAMARRQATPQA